MEVFGPAGQAGRSFIVINIKQNTCHKASPLLPKGDLGEQASPVVFGMNVGNQAFLHSNCFSHKMVADGVGFLLQSQLGLGSVVNNGQSP